MPLPAAAATYRRPEPEKAPLYEVLAGHLGTFLDWACRPVHRRSLQRGPTHKANSNTRLDSLLACIWRGGEETGARGGACAGGSSLGRRGVEGGATRVRDGEGGLIWRSSSPGARNRLDRPTKRPFVRPIRIEHEVSATLLAFLHLTLSDTSLRSA